MLRDRLLRVRCRSAPSVLPKCSLSAIRVFSACSRCCYQVLTWQAKAVHGSTSQRYAHHERTAGLLPSLHSSRCGVTLGGSSQNCAR